MSTTRTYRHKIWVEIERVQIGKNGKELKNHEQGGIFGADPEKAAETLNLVQALQIQKNLIDYAQGRKRPKLFITVEGGIITEILSTSADVEITVMDEDQSEGSEFVYFRATPDKIITPDEYTNAIEEGENDQMNRQDEEE